MPFTVLTALYTKTLVCDKHGLSSQYYNLRVLLIPPYSFGRRVPPPRTADVRVERIYNNKYVQTLLKNKKNKIYIIHIMRNKSSKYKTMFRIAMYYTHNIRVSVMSLETFLRSEVVVPLTPICHRRHHCGNGTHRCHCRRAHWHSYLPAEKEMTQDTVMSALYYQL